MIRPVSSGQGQLGGLRARSLRPGSLDLLEHGHGLTYEVETAGYANEVFATGRL
jgi:hypothetical protein